MHLALPSSVAAVVLWLAPLSAAQTPREVQVREGRLQGTCNALGVCQFLGIPYAAPPLGKLRWKPPQRAPHWHGLRNASSYGSQCLQPQAVVGYGKFAGDESCLFLNVWMPAGFECAGASCAVMFWIHGGAYTTGSGWADGGNLVALAKNLVVVSINYRLNIFGFLGSRVLRGRDTVASSTGNYGIQDQRAAMLWVQQNIHRFGGNPGNVMIFGQSAGGGSVSMHLTMSKSWPFYHKAAIESGAFSYWNAQPMEEAEQQYQDVLGASGCGAQGGLSCLLSMDAMELANKLSNLPLRWRPYGCPWAPTVDGVELEKLPWDLRDEGRFNKEVPILMGYNKDEGTGGVSFGSEQAVKIYRKVSAMTAGDFARLVTTAQYNVSLERLPDVLDVYSVNATGGDPDYTSWYWAATHFSGDYSFSCPSRRTARAISKFSSQSLYMYYFAHAPRDTPPSFTGVNNTNDTSGVYHTAELVFVFMVEDEDMLGGPHLIGSDEKLLAETIAGYWVNFARSSNPNSPGRGGAPTSTNLTVTWEPFSERHETSLRLDLPHLSALEGRDNRQCDLVDSLGVLVSPLIMSSFRNNKGPQEASPTVLMV